MSDDQPVKTKVTYAVYVNGLPMPLIVTCDDIRDESGYIRYYDGDVPVAIVPVGQLIAAAVRSLPPAPVQAEMAVSSMAEVDAVGRRIAERSAMRIGR